MWSQGCSVNFQALSRCPKGLWKWRESLIIFTFHPVIPTAILPDRRSSTMDPCRVGLRLIMPVRSLNSFVLKWPTTETVRKALCVWSKEVAREHPEVKRIGLFGSCVTGGWGVGSDLDLIILVDSSGLPFEQRATVFDTTCLPVPTDVLVYTEAEWNSLDPKRRFTRVLTNEAVWVYER
jgi:hypothetical protein